MVSPTPNLFTRQSARNGVISVAPEFYDAGNRPLDVLLWIFMIVGANVEELVSVFCAAIN